ncbi:ABC transporter ATP-binding protein [Thermocoleostomius sinensis]|uniref:ABC transporter ATP-binding protein n=1 Tax=Thermocoleostomius sinensis A174 TaxID=2016057 RepID=A0A9E9C8F8_9CYAN|nr:ABC transporter ATP-binding protein [Thermocoleostomius sinensis]WAL61369.1 ABC transporter ATP-binding protein [Thermocoleostomius sinensis A174]
MWHFLQSVTQLVKFVWRSHPLGCVVAVILTILQGLIPLANAWVLKVLLDWLAEQFAGQKDIINEQLMGLLIAQTVLIVTAAMLPNVSRYLNAELGRRLTISIQSSVYQKINQFRGIAHFENPEVYDTIRLAEEGAEQSSGQTLQVLTDLIQSLVTLLSFVSVLISFNLFLANLVLLAALPQLITQLQIGRQRFGLAYELSPTERRKHYYSFLLSDVYAVKEVRLFGLGTYFLDKLLQLYQRTHHAERQQQQRELRWELGLNIISSIVASIAFVIVVSAAFAERVSLGDIMLYVNAVTSVQMASGRLIGAIAGLSEGVLFYSFFEKLLNLSPDLPVPATPYPVPSLSSGIELRNVSFRYSDHHPWILRDVNLQIPAHHCLALVGLNGAGKSTLVKLLTRLYDPTIGQILWDGIDIREFEPDEFRRHISTIFQDFMHYDLTVRENIGLGDLSRIQDMPWIQKAAKQANIHEEILRLPHDYETEITRMFAEEMTGEKAAGIDLSGGQWQRIATARMFAREADLLILDEPTAALDAQAEYETYSHFKQLMADRTSLLISHRFSTVRMADAIAVLEAGRIVEYGSHEALMRSNGTYAKLYRLQAESYMDSPQPHSPASV